jgi:hypothetical protein
LLCFVVLVSFYLIKSELVLRGLRSKVPCCGKDAAKFTVFEGHIIGIIAVT